MVFKNKKHAESFFDASTDPKIKASDKNSWHRSICSQVIRRSGRGLKTLLMRRTESILTANGTIWQLPVLWQPSGRRSKANGTGSEQTAQWHIPQASRSMVQHTTSTIRVYAQILN